MPQQTNSRIAGGTIYPFTFIQRFVGTIPTTLAASTPVPPELLCLQATGAGVEILGICQEWTNAPNGLIGQTAGVNVPAATVGQPLVVYGDGAETIIMVGSGYNVVVDDDLTSDASGNAIPANVATSSTQWLGARALENGNAGNPIRVTVVLRGPYKAT